MYVPIYTLDLVMQKSDENIRKFNPSEVVRVPGRNATFYGYLPLLQFSWFWTLALRMNFPFFYFILFMLSRGQGVREGSKATKHVKRDNVICVLVLHRKVKNNLGYTI